MKLDLSVPLICADTAPFSSRLTCRSHGISQPNPCGRSVDSGLFCRVLQVLMVAEAVCMLFELPASFGQFKKLTANPAKLIRAMKAM